MHINHWPLVSPWSLTALGLFALIGTLWLPVVVIQILMSREANQAESVTNLTRRFHRRFLSWFVLGVPTFMIVVFVFWLMVAKPLPLEGY